MIRPLAVAALVALSAPAAAGCNAGATLANMSTRSATANVADALACIRAIDRAGPTLQSVIAIAGDVEAQAQTLDAAGGKRGPLHGVPILIKDNIAVKGLPTTAGSLALAANMAEVDAPLVARLRRAGAIILGKANLSEWGNIRGLGSIGGWSAIGGQTRYPYALDRSPDGSSAGSAVAVAAGIVPVAIGTETDGSIVHPASVNGIVGLKPTVGLVSTEGIIPISASQDTAGPMARTVRDAAILFDAMADPVPGRESAVAGLSPSALKGARLGVMRWVATDNPAVDRLFASALKTLTDAGAVLVELPDYRPDPAIDAAEFTVLMTELHAGLNVYLAKTPGVVRTRSLAEVIAFNARTPQETSLFGQELFERAAQMPGLDDPGYRAALALARRLARDEGIDRLVRDHDLVALVGPTSALARPIDPAGASTGVGRGSNRLPAVAGYPHLTVPMGAVRGLPVGLSFIGPATSEARLMALGHAYEFRVPKRQPPRFPATLLDDPAIASALARPLP
jgi:amidase